MEFIEPDWTIANDLESVHVGINTRIWLCHQKNEIPTRILLGREHSRLYWEEEGRGYIPKGQHFYGSFNIPMLFNVPGLYGIGIESMPRPKKEKAPIKSANPR